MEDQVFILTNKWPHAANELLDRGIKRHQFQSPRGPYLIVTSPDQLRGRPRGIRYCVIGNPRQEVLEMAWVLDGEEIQLPQTKETQC